MIKRENIFVVKLISVFAIGAIIMTGCGKTGLQYDKKAEGIVSQEDESLDFFKSLDYENGLEVVTEILQRYPLQYGTTLGIDGAPQIRPLEFKYEEDGVLYFDTVVFYQSYKEMTEYPYIQICVCDQETMSYIRLGGKVNFTKDEDVINKCFDNSEVLTKSFGDKREFVIGYYLTEVWAEFESLSDELDKHEYQLTNKFDE